MGTSLVSPKAGHFGFVSSKVQSLDSGSACSCYNVTIRIAVKAHTVGNAFLDQSHLWLWRRILPFTPVVWKLASSILITETILPELSLSLPLYICIYTPFLFWFFLWQLHHFVLGANCPGVTHFCSVLFFVCFNLYIFVNFSCFWDC